ncbi:MAG: CocE/NonD family hydrolase [bacterium]|nr:CocE/NonD family hydrolase [bacterium]
MHKRTCEWVIRAALGVAIVAAGVGPASAFDLQAGIGFVGVRNGVQGNVVGLETPGGLEVQRGTVDRFGSLVFRELGEGNPFVVRDLTAGGGGQPVTTLVFTDHPDQSFYQAQTLVAGYQYIQMRDGTLLAAMIRPPLGRTMADGPFPTLIEYSGYSPADPDNPQPSTLLASALGYATVGVNMRGSGCSGGVIDLFDLPTTADGYDIIETVGVQPWVKFAKVGMIGISFPGISQLFVAGARPPHLGAVAPFSTIADIYRAPGFPGGIFNNGFAESWLRGRNSDAEPAPEGGQSWARRRARNGDQTCIANQRLRLQTLDAVEFTQSHPFYLPYLMDARSPINWVGDIQVPTFLAGAWQDEQTGGDFASYLRLLPKRRDVKVSLINGVHTSAMEPAILWNWIAFLDLYVAHQLPDPSRAAPFAPIVYSQILGGNVPTPPLPVDRFDGITDYDQARALFEADPRVRVLFENGGGSPQPGLPAPRFEVGFQRWPANGARATAWYLGPDGTLARKRPRKAGEGVDAYNPDPSVRPAQTLPGSGEADSWSILPPYDWAPYVDGTALAYATEPLIDDVTIVGPGSVDLYLRSSAEDTDIQVTLSEIRPDGLETYVQSGWLRASHRKLDRKKRTRLEPWPTHLEKDAAPMPDGKFALVRVGIFPVAHVFRKGSRIRLGIAAPGGDRTRWRFDTFLTGGTVRNEISRMHAKASRVVLPVIPGVVPPPTLPPCPGLRGQPCRTYRPAGNGG